MKGLALWAAEVVVAIFAKILAAWRRDNAIVDQGRSAAHAAQSAVIQEVEREQKKVDALPRDRRFRLRDALEAMIARQERLSDVGWKALYAVAAAVALWAAGRLGLTPPGGGK